MPASVEYVLAVVEDQQRSPAGQKPRQLSFSGLGPRLQVKSMRNGSCNCTAVGDCTQLYEPGSTREFVFDSERYLD